MKKKHLIKIYKNCLNFGWFRLSVFSKTRNKLTLLIFGNYGIHIEPKVKINNLSNLKLSNNILINQGFCFFGSEKLSIGSNTYIAQNVTILTSTHRTENMNEFSLPVSIGVKCWVGAGVIILPGITIGDNSIIGAGSVVTRNVPANSVFAGNPARFIKERSLEGKYRSPNED